MATLIITEHSGVARGAGQSGIPFVALPPITTQAISISGTSAQSAALNAKTTLVRLMTDTDTYIAVGTNPTAVTTDLPLKAGIEYYFGVKAGHLIAARTA